MGLLFATSPLLIVALGYPKKGEQEIKQSREAYTVARLPDLLLAFFRIAERNDEKRAVGPRLVYRPRE